jgi:phytoene dehydrogenase-like protein
MFVGEGKPRVLENPLRRPLATFGALNGRVLSLMDQLRLVRLVARWAGGVDKEEMSTEALLRSGGFSDKFFTRFARPFFGGVLLDPSLGTSSRLFASYLRYFATGAALLPGDGIGGITTQLAAALPAGGARYGCRAAEILFRGAEAAGVVLPDGTAWQGDHVVLAVDEPALCCLLGKGEPRAALATAVHYFRARRAFYRGSWLCLPPRREESPVLHAALVSNVAPTLAPEGAHLWSVTVMPDHPRAADAEFAAREVASWFDAEAAELSPLAYVRVPYAVPAQPPGFAQRPAPWGELPPGLIVAGDAVCGASIEAAMASGEAAAKKVISSAPRN